MSPIKTKAIFHLALLSALLLSLGSGFAAQARAEEQTMSAEAAGPAYREQQQNAASFASDWLTDLDLGDYEAALAVYTLDGDHMAAKERLQTLRSGLGKLLSRSYDGAQVMAVANDDSEHKVRIAYTTEFTAATVLETVDVLLWPRATVVLSYTVEKNNPGPLLP